MGLKKVHKKKNKPTKPVKVRATKAPALQPTIRSTSPPPPLSADNSKSIESKDTEKERKREEIDEKNENQKSDDELKSKKDAPSINDGETAPPPPPTEPIAKEQEIATIPTNTTETPAPTVG
ncbi:hypothetical protein CYY_009132 [Polysphondylium violaceum]|uniref:Uncharacterized protein n=1 Tax=Polysphondylium violaceum TaxID=133409 RepID=A0A8J4UWD2_9MYCE|nr:hypothetical protein CYY_009132 [Polysphondylium violaceum]